MKKYWKFLVLGILTSVMFTSCSEDEPTTQEKQFGKEGTHEVSKYTEENYAFTTVYYPTDIVTMDKKTPLLFFVSGWFDTPKTSEKYESLLQFIASHGYTVIYTDEGLVTDPQHCIDGFNRILDSNNATIVDQIIPNIDTSRIGAIGHSAGGGMLFKVLDYYSTVKHYGSNGRLITAYDPWYAFGMNENKMKTLPSNTNLVFIKFGAGGNNDADGTDARIPLTEYYLLESITDTKKDYQIYDKESAKHDYPTGNRAYTEMQGILKPLDALLDYTFVEQSEKTRIVALENGNDDPYANGNGIQVVLDEYDYPCDGANTLINYCIITE